MIRKITVLGAGPAGLWAAKTLLEKNPGLEVTVIEQNSFPGGMTASFTCREILFDLGSHRLHPAASHLLMNDIRNLLGSELLERKRNGRIFLEGRFVKFPLKPLNLMLRLPPSFTMGVTADLVSGPFRRKANENATFSEVLRAGLGRTISEKFYFPYAEKLWGLSPEKIHAVQARKRVSSGSIGTIIRKALAALKGGKKDTNIFYYPAGGFGRICEKAAERVEKLGGNVILNSRVDSIAVQDRGITITSLDTSGQSTKTDSDFVFSTIPVTDFCTALSEVLPDNITESLGRLSYRSMIFSFLELDTSCYTEFDAHYFPGKDIVFSRMSEPKNYSGSHYPPDRTGLCFEIPCWKSDPIWKMSSNTIKDIVLKNLELTGLPPAPVISSSLGRVTYAYPSYSIEFHSAFDAVDNYLDGFDNLVTLGRQGLFAHDNTHHTIEMGIAAANCLNPEIGFDRKKWSSCRDDFQQHIVVD